MSTVAPRQSRRTFLAFAAAAGLLPTGAWAGDSAGQAIGLPGSPFGVAWGMYYGVGEHPVVRFLPEIRRMGGGFSKLYLFWGQVEPEPGVYDWSAIDAYVGQLSGPDEGLVSIFTSSPWATVRGFPPGETLQNTKDPSLLFLPPTPAKDLDAYYRFIHAIVSRYRGKVRYWQNDAEANNPLYWHGSVEAFSEHLETFHRAVKAADPEAQVVLGYDGLFTPPGHGPAGDTPNPGLVFFDKVLARSGQRFDIFDIRLYGDPYTIPGRVEHMRTMMRGHGYDKPVICTEYAGPLVFDFPRAIREAPQLLGWLLGSVGAHVEDKEAAFDAVTAPKIAALYGDPSSLPPEVRMFMTDAPPQLDQRLRRLQGRDLVMRNVLALSASVQKTIYWQLSEITPKDDRRNDIWSMVYSKIALVGFEDGRVARRYPLVEVFARMTHVLKGVQRVSRLEQSDERLFVFKVERAAKPALYVAWARTTPGSEVEPNLPLSLDWPSARARITDVFGATVRAKPKADRLVLEVSSDPLYLEAV